MTDWQYEYNRLVNTAMHLNRMYKSKSRRIDKAIKYLNDMNNSDYLHISICIKELLEILKGEQDETTTIK